MKKFFFGLVLGGLIVFGYFFTKENPDNSYIIKAKTRINKIINKTPTTGLANPASTFCVENNGSLELKNTETGSIGICEFSNGSSCEERAFFKGECKPDEQTEENQTPIIDENQIDENQTPIINDKPETSEKPVACTMEYAPVCARVEIQCVTKPCDPIEQTFGNKCTMNANKLATFLYEGECRKPQECPSYSPPSPDFCKDGTIVDGGLNEDGCQLPPKCIE